MKKNRKKIHGLGRKGLVQGQVHEMVLLGPGPVQMSHAMLFLYYVFSISSTGEMWKKEILRMGNVEEAHYTALAVGSF